MLKFNGLMTAAAFGVMAGLMTALPQAAAAGSDMKIYPYASSANYCPAGLQPVTISGVICCGTPNTQMSYQSVMAHPVARKKHHHKAHRVTHRAASHCPVGTKGCTFD